MTLTRPLPGISFRAEPPPLADPLPRMDVAAFVGFAASGPLDVPVAVEGVDQFRDVFGDAPPIVWDPASGAWQRACLAPAVRDFFAQGGRRCWVVRVAGSTATRNRFPIAGLLQVSYGGYTPAFALARSAGSWSDTLSIGASLLLGPVRVADVAESAPEGTRLAVTLGTERGSPVQPGDTVQIDFDGAERPRAYLVVDRAMPAPAPLDAAATWQAVEGRAYWFRPLADAGLIDGTVSGDALSQSSALSASHLDTS
ncbi:MAG TPA: hypothetical protein VGW38_02325, partial [Chloroflexota bacterium]|nr:hypothetical protein [Chloroflexota bacterium]